MCDRVIAESGKECEYLTNFYDDNFIERSSIGYYQYLHSSLSSFSAYHPNNSDHSDKPLLPKISSVDVIDAEQEQHEEEENNIYQHPFWPSQSYLNRLMPKKEEKEKDREVKSLLHTIPRPTKGSTSGKNSTIPRSINELITDNFMLLPSEYIAKYDNFYKMSDILKQKLKLMGNHECINNERHRFLRCTFTAKDKINEYLSSFEHNMQYSSKWHDVVSSVSSLRQSKYEHGWNSSWVTPLLQITKDDSVKFNVLKIVNELLLSSDLYCLYYESPSIISTLKQWLFDLLSSDIESNIITSSLLNLTIHTGSISAMFDVFHSLLSSSKDTMVNICEISRKIESEINYWYEFGCPLIPNNTISSFMHERYIDHQGLYLHSLDALRNITYSNIVSDGTFIYIYHRKFGLFKIGTGYNGCIKGKIYGLNSSFTAQILAILSPPGLSCKDSSLNGLGNAQITSIEKYGQRYYGGNISKTYQSHSANPSKDIMVTSLIIFGANKQLFFRSREMLDNLMFLINKETLQPERESLINIDDNKVVWVADIDRITCYNYEYLLALHCPVICKHKLATRQGICSYSITGKRSVPQRWTQIIINSDSNNKYYICAACSNRCYRESGNDSLGYKKTVLSATLPRINANEAMFCDCGSDRLPAPKNKDKYKCVCVNKEYLNRLECHLDARLKEPRIESEKWRDDLATNSKVDTLDSVHKWYTSTIIDVDDTSDRIRINYEGWSSRYDEWLGRYDPRIQPHKTRAIGGRESGGIIGSIDQKGAPRQINQLSPVKTEFKVYIFDTKYNVIGHLQCAPIGNQYKNQLPSCYDFYSTGNNIVFQWISNNQCGVKIHLAVYPISNINKYLYSNHPNYDTDVIQPNVYHVPYQPIIHRNNPLLPVTKAFGLTLMDVMSGGVCYDSTNHCLWCYDPTFMIIDQIQCLPKPTPKLDDILESKLESLPPSPKTSNIEEEKEKENEKESVEVPSSSSSMPLNCAITIILEQLSRLIEYEMDHSYLIEINNADKQELESLGMGMAPEKKSSEVQEESYLQTTFKKKRKYRQKLTGSGSGSVSPLNELITKSQQSQESYNLGSGIDAILKYVKRLQCLSMDDLIDSLNAAQKLILFAHKKTVESLTIYQSNNFQELKADMLNVLEHMVKLRLYAFKIFMKFTKIIPLKQISKDKDDKENETLGLSLNEILDMIAYIATEEDIILHNLNNNNDQHQKIYKLLFETQRVCINAVIHGTRFFVDLVGDTYDIWQFLSVIVKSNHILSWKVIKALTMALSNKSIFDKLSDTAFQKDILIFLINESFKTTKKLIGNVLSNDKEKEKDYSVTRNVHLQILLVFHHKILWKAFQSSFTADDEYLVTFIEYIEYIFMETKELLNSVESAMQNRRFTLNKLQHLTKTLSQSPVNLLIPSIISFLSSPPMVGITWSIFNGKTDDGEQWRKCNIHLNDLVLILDKFIDFCGIDTCNLSLISKNAKNRSNTYPMVLNSEHPWKCMQNKWYVIQDLNLSSLYLTFHPNSSTPISDGELKIGLQQHHVASIPRTALDIHLRGLGGAWPILPIEIPTDRLYLRWHKTESPSFKPYVDLLNEYFNKDTLPNNSMWGFRMESYGLLKSSRTIYKQPDPTILKYGFKQNRLPFLVDIQTQIISLSKSLGFHYILTHHPRSYRKGRSIPLKLFSSKIFESGWDGKTLEITDQMNIIRIKQTKSQQENGDDKESKETETETAKEEVKVFDIDYDDPSKAVPRSLYRDAATIPSNKHAISLWLSVSQNLVIPKSFQSIMEQLRLPVLSSLIRHLPLEQQSLFVEENATTKGKDMEVIKNVFLVGNNILRWVLDNLMSEKKAFQQVETVYKLCLQETELQQRVTELTEKVKLFKDQEREQKDKDEKEEEKEQEKEEEKEEITILNTELVQILKETGTIQCELRSHIKKACKTIQPFLHKYFSIYCEGNGARLGFNRSNLMSYTKFDLNEISDHLNVWITKCLESLLDHKPDLDICLSHFSRSVKNRIEIILQMQFNSHLSCKSIQHFLCSDYYFSYSDNPLFEINNIIIQRQSESKQRVKAIQHLLELIECSEQCNGTHPLALTVNIPPSPLKRWCYMNGLEGLQFKDMKQLKVIFCKWLKKMLNIGDNLQQFTKQKIKQQTFRQKLIKMKSPKKVNKEEKKYDEQEKVIVKKKKILNQQLITISTEHFLDIYQIVLETISSAQFDRNDMNMLFETKAMQTLFEWESKMCQCQCPVQLMHKSDFIWTEILKVLHSCSEGVFQWIESDDKPKQIALELSTNILSQILNRLHTELQFICGTNDDNLNREIASLEELNKRKLKSSEIKQWTNKRILTSHQSILKYFQLLHRLSTFKIAHNLLTSHNDKNNKIYCSYLTLLFAILCNHQYLQHFHHRIYSLCIQKLCNLLPTLNFDSFNNIMNELNENTLLSFNNDQTFLEFVLKSIGSYLYLDRPSLMRLDNMTKTSSILSESDKISGYSDARQGTYSLILKVPPEINSSAFIRYLVPKYLNAEFTAMNSKLSNVSSTPLKNISHSKQKSNSDKNILHSFVDEVQSNYNDGYNDEDDYNEDDDEYDENQREHDDEDEDDDDYDEDEDQDEDEDEDEEYDDHEEHQEQEEEPPRAFDAILAFEEFMSSAVAASRLKANIVGLKSMIDAKNKFDDKDEDETKIWLKKVTDSLNEEKSAILFTGRLKHCYTLASMLANNGAIVYIEKSRNIADRNENLVSMNNEHMDAVIPLQSQLMWHYYFMNGLIKSLIASPSWFDAINKCFNNVSLDFIHLLDDIDTKNEIDWMNNDWSNKLVMDLNSNAQNHNKLNILLGMLLCLNNNYYGENSNIYKYLNRNNDHRNLFVGCRVRVTHLTKLQFEGLITYINTKAREITILVDNFYLKKKQNTKSSALKPFEVIRLSEQHEIEIIDFLSDKDIISEHSKVVSSISLNIIQKWPNLLQKLQIVLKTWTKMNAMLSVKHQQAAAKQNIKKQEEEHIKQENKDEIPKTPTKTPLQHPLPQQSDTKQESQAKPQTNTDDDDDDGFDLAELQKAMALSMSVDNLENKENDDDNNDAKDVNDNQNMDKEMVENDDKEDEDDEKQLFPSIDFVETCDRLQDERQQYQMLFNLIKSQMLNVVHNTLLFCRDESKHILLESKHILRSFADTFISMANTQASSSSNWQCQYEDSLRIYHDLLTHNHLLSEFNRHIVTIMENDALKEEEEDDDDDEKKEAKKEKRLTSEQIGTVPHQPRYDQEEKKVIGMDGDLLNFPTKWNLRFLRHFIIHPQSLQIEYKENKGKSLIITTNNKVPFVYHYYFEIKIIKIEPNTTAEEDKAGNLSVGLRSNWADFFVSNTGWKWMTKRRFLQFDTDSTSSVVNTSAPKIDFFESAFILSNDKGKDKDQDQDKDKKAKPDIMSSMYNKFVVGDYLDVYDDSHFIGVWKSAKITAIKAENKTIKVKILENDKEKEFALTNKNVYKNVAPFCSKCDSASPPIKERDFNEATDFGLRRFVVGDYIGCGINQIDGQIYFTLNGKRFWGNKATFNNVPLFDFCPAIEIRNANVMIEANFGQKEFEYKDYEGIVLNGNDNKNKEKWKDRVVEYETQLNSATKQSLAAKRNKEELRSMSYARRLDIAESISAGGLLVGINQRQLLRGIEFNQDDPNRVVDWALNQENYESAFAELGPSKSEREIEAEEKEAAKKKERMNKLKLKSRKEQTADTQNKQETLETTADHSKTINVPCPDYFVIQHDAKTQNIGKFENYDSYYDGVELHYGFNVQSMRHVNNILPIHYTQTVSDPLVEKWLNKVESRLTIHGMDRFTMIEILNRLRSNPHDTVALMQAREIDPGLEKCPIQRSSSSGSSPGTQSPISPSKYIKRAVKEVNVTPELLKFGVNVHVKADPQSRIAMIRAKIWLDELENVRNSIGKIIYIDTDTKPKLALVLFEKQNEGKQERWWLPLDVLQIVILDYNSSTISPPNMLCKSFLHNINKTSSSIAKICLELLYNFDSETVSNMVPFDSIQNYQYYASFLYNPFVDNNYELQQSYKYAENVLDSVNKQQQREALNEIIHESLQQLTSSKNTFNINMNPTQNALLIRQNAFHYKVSIGCDILIQIIKDCNRKTKNDDALTIYGDMGCNHILYRSKLHDLENKIFRKSEIWISVTGDTDLTLALSPIPRLMNLFLCPQIRDKWDWDLVLINTLIDGYFKSQDIPPVVASEWMLSISYVLKNAISHQQQLIQQELEQEENAEIKQCITNWINKLQMRLRFYYSSDIEEQPDNNLSLSCLHSKLLKHILSARYFAHQLFNINDGDADDHWYINATNTIKIAQNLHKNNKFPLEFVSSLCSDYLFEEKTADDSSKDDSKVDDANGDGDEHRDDDENGDKDVDVDVDGDKQTMNEEKEITIKEKPTTEPLSNDKLCWLQGWNRQNDMLLVNILTKYNMELKFSELYTKIGSKHNSISSLSQNDDENQSNNNNEDTAEIAENEKYMIPSEYRSMIDKILHLTPMKQLKENKIWSDIPQYDWKLIVFYRCIILCEFNKNIKSFLSLIDIEENDPFYDLMQCVLPLVFSNLKQDYFHRILDYTATPSTFRQPFDLQIDRILSTDSFSFYDSVLFQAHQVLLHTDSARLRTPWSLGRGLRTVTPFIIKLHDEPVEGDEGPFRAFFARLVDELQHNYHNKEEEDHKEKEEEEEEEEMKRSDDINYSCKNEDGIPMTLALLVPTPNRSSDLGDNREYFMFNPNLLYYLQSQSFYCLGRIIGISIRCCVPLHFDFPIWIWILIKNMTKYSRIHHKIKEFDIDFHMNYLKEFDITTFQSLENIIKLKDDTAYQELLEMLNVSQMMNTTMSNKDLSIKYTFNERLALVKDILIYHLYTRFEGQIYALICGLSEIIPLNAMNLFNENELKLKICGSSKIDMPLLKDHTVYRDGLSLNHELIKNFWSVVLSLDEDLKPKFVDFIYAQKRLPSKQEFIRKNLRLQISLLNVDNPDQTLPQSQTCFLNLQIPQYTTKQSLKHNFIKALTGASGFYKESSE